MITGIHAIINTTDATALRAWFRDVLGFDSVDSGDGWLIFALPPAELGIHPAENSGTHELYLLCDDVEKTIAEFQAKGVPCSDVREFDWGRLTSITAPEGSTIHVYEPKHASPLAR
jgi:catechol 2,3-dioxygenase-like lactoylglutathione lyase family enzyme